MVYARTVRARTGASTSRSKTSRVLCHEQTNGAADAIRWAEMVKLLCRLVRSPAERDAIILCILTSLNFVLILRAFNAGIIADNDFVCHYGYARIFAERMLPAGQAWFGWRPEHHLGTPFLLFNPPPLLYWSTAILSALGLSVLGALKFLLCLAFLSVPPLCYALARAIAPREPLFPLCAALVAALFSSELAGMDFFFRNGMVNAAVAVPVFIAGVTFFRRALDTVANLSASLLGAALSVSTLGLLHLQTGYCLGLFAVAMALWGHPSTWGRCLLRVAAAFVIGLGLAGFWLIPSQTFAGSGQVLATWIRPPAEVLLSWLSGRIFSSYAAGFSPRYFSESSAGLAATILGAVGIAVAIRSRNYRVLSLATGALVALWLALGPRCAFVLSGLPLYDRLLWYRLVTFAIIAWQVVAAWGLSLLLSRCLTAPTVRNSIRTLLILTLAGWSAWCAMVLLARASLITTEADFPRAQEDLNTVAAWIRAQSGSHGRIYSEFPKTGVPEIVSVNYARHLLPVLSGADEVMGWSYENNLVGQQLVRQGLLHENPFAILDLSRRLNIRYVSAQSLNFRMALLRDPRWRRVVRTETLDLFEAVGFEDAVAEDVSNGRPVAVATSVDSAGGFRLSLTSVADAGEQVVLVKYGYSAAWRVARGAAEIRPTSDGLFELHLAERTVGQRIEVTWDISRERRLGRGVSIATGFLVLLWMLMMRRSRATKPWGNRVLPRVGIVVVIAATVVTVVRAVQRPCSEFGFGIQGGMVGLTAADVIRVGAFDDASNGDANHLVLDTWGVPAVAMGKVGRTCGSCRAIIAVAPERNAQLRIEGVSVQSDETVSNERAGGVPLSLRIEDLATNETRCELAGVLGETVEIPAACVGHARAVSVGPGVRLGLDLRIADRAVIHRIDIGGGMVFLEGESFVNSSHDGGGDGFYYAGLPGCLGHGVWMTFLVPPGGGPMVVSKDVSLSAGWRYELWIRTLTEPGPTHNRATFVGIVDGQEVGRTDAVSSEPPPLSGCPLRAQWIRLGAFQGRSKSSVMFRAEADRPESSVFDMDLVAFVPLPN